MKNKSVMMRILALALTVVMVFGMLPSVAIALPAPGDAVIRTADTTDTMNDWQSLFLDPHTSGVELTTENAGFVWTDKSVFEADAIPSELTSATSTENKNLNVTDTGDNFLVALSAISSNKEVIGYSTIPTDTVFILDLSSSMRTQDDRRQSAVDELVEATNKAIHDLQSLNKNNRVAVVCFAGNTNQSFSDAGANVKVIMPMDTYTAGSTVTVSGQQVGKFLESYDGDMALRISANVKNSAGTTVSGSMETARSTFTQSGIFEAMNLLLGVSDTAVTGGVQAGAERKPIIVMMTDGEPTLANRDYNGTQNSQGKYVIGSSEMYNYDALNHRDTIAFMTQLTAAWAKREVSRHYKETPLFYTLSYGNAVSSRDEALSVVDPANTCPALNEMWDTFLRLNRAGNAYEQVQVYSVVNNRGNVTDRYYAQNDFSDPLTAADKIYVNEHFHADNDDALLRSFQSIVDEIKLQSKYYPTYVENDHDHDGYITFTDKIGGYMEVTDIHGFVIGNQYFSGETLAKNFVAGGGDLGTPQNPTGMGNNLVQSVKERLHISSTETARALIQNAYDYGQLRYFGADNFSNYIGWYSNDAGEYIDFWHEGTTAGVPAGATHIVKSYGFLGKTNASQGVSATDMLYASVRVTKEIGDQDADGITGETFLTWQIPASLIPTITYQVDVTVDADGEVIGVNKVSLEDVDASGNNTVKPIRLLYEVALRSDIQDWNITQLVSDIYRDNTANKDAGYVFYSNRWNKTSEGGVAVEDMTTRNTYSHFEPSEENERYYYIADSVIYTAADENAEYTGAAKPSGGTYYRSFNCYEKLENGTYRIHKHFEHISPSVLEQAKQVNGSWVIPKGLIHRYLDDQFVSKDAANDTQTMAYAYHPIVVSQTVAGVDHYYSYATLGNNGKLVVAPATGIKLTKTLTESVPGANDTFTFTIAGGSISDAKLIRLNADGTEKSREALPASGEFTVAAGETVYIIGLSAGNYTITEANHATYSVSSVTGATAVNGAQATVTVENQKIADVGFANAPKGYGNLYITKEMTSTHTIPDSVKAQTFTVKVKLPGIAEGTEFDVVDSKTPTVTVTGKVNAEHYLQLPGATAGTYVDFVIGNGQTYEILGLPEHTVAQVEEMLTAEQQTYFGAPVIKTRDHTGATQEANNEVTIFRNQNATAVITNTYTPVPASLSLNIAGTKTFQWDTATNATFEFYVEQLVNGSWVEVTGKTASVTYTDQDTEKTKNFSISLLDQMQFIKEGVYSFQVRERIPEDGNKVPGVTYDRATHTFTITVTDVGGALQTTVSGHHGSESVTQNQDGSWTVMPAFTNEYNKAPVVLDVKKTTPNESNTPGISPAGFLIIAEQVDASGNVISGGAKLEEYTDAAGEVRFTATYETAGDHYYKVYEQIPAEAVLVTEGKYAGKYALNGWYFDPASYLIHVNVALAAGSTTDLVAVVSVDGTASTTGNTASIGFENVYDAADVELNLDTAVKKALTGRDLVANDFTFYVYPNNNHTGTPLLTGKNAAAAMVDGVATAAVDFDGVMTFDKVGTYEYDVVELIPADSDKLGGVTYDSTVYDLVVEVKDVNGQLQATYFYEDSTDTVVSFCNTYKAADKELVIDGTKTLTGRDLVASEFRFDLVQVTSQTDMTPVAGGVTREAESDSDANNDRATTFQFPAITYTSADVGKTYYYQISERYAGETILGVAYDTAEYVVQVDVSDNGDGTLKIAQQVLNAPNGVVFANTYSAMGTTATLPGSKTLTGRVLADDEFEFSLTEKTDDTYATDKPAGIKETVKNKADGSITFQTLNFSTVGDYYYVVEEAAGTAGGITYDNTKYHVHIAVEDNLKGNLVATTHIYLITSVEENGQTVELSLPVSSIQFKNTYTITGETSVKLSGEKTLDVQSGSKTLTDDLFTFVVKDDAGNEVVSAKNKGNTITFPEITYTVDDVDKEFHYTIEEVNTGIPGVTYSNVKYAVDVTVGHKDGKVVVDYTITDDQLAPVQNTDIDFVNVYNTSGEKSVKLSGTKTMEVQTGTFTMTDGMFHFVIKDKDGNEVASAKNKGNAITFPEIKYTVADCGKTYQYTIEEVNDGRSGVIYSDVKYKLHVAVADLDGQISVDYSLTNAEGNAVAADQVNFTNVYDVTKTSATIQGEKTLEGRDLVAEEFKFDLYKTASDFKVTGDPVKTASNDADGKFSFVTEALDVGTYYYVVKEQIPAQKLPCVTYDETVYNVTVQITDAGGSLQTKVSYAKGSEAVDKMTFVNTYYVEPTIVQIDIQKTLDNKTDKVIGLDGFQFVVMQDGKQLIKVESNDKGTAAVQLSFGEQDVGKTYTFQVKEKKGLKLGMTYDETVHTITIKVTMGADGKLITNVNGKDTDKASVGFTNVYAPAVTPFTGDQFPIAMVTLTMLVSALAVVLMLLHKRMRYCAKH